MHLAPDLVAFALRHDLADDAVHDLEELIARRLGTTGPQPLSVDDLHSFEPDAESVEETAELQVHVHGSDPDPGRAPMPDHLEDLGLIGAGGMGEVRRVRDTHLQRTVAMKVIRGDLMVHPTEINRFLDEARATAQLQHPGVAPVHELGTLPDGRPYFTMREVRGRSLRALLDERAPLDVLVGVLVKVCEAVGYAHSMGVLHRDLKPENVHVGDFGEVLVLDWGLARAQPDSDPDFLPTEEMDASLAAVIAERVVQEAAVGTPAYLPPERANGDDRLDARGDVYSLGAMLYEMIARRPPYVGSDLLQQVRAGPPPPLGRRDDQGLSTICALAMQRDPVGRYPDAMALGAAIKARGQG